MKPFISGEEARHLVENCGAVLVDVRNPQEYATGSAPGAINLPLHTLPLRHEELDSSKPIIVYCLSGARSSQAHMLLQNMGFNNVKNLGSLHNYANS